MVMTQSPLRTRDEIADAYKWNAESVYPTRAAWQQAADDLPGLIAAAAAFAGRLSEGAATLADFMDASKTLQLAMSRLYFYAAMSVAVDSGDDEATAMVMRAQGLVGRARGATAFANPTLLAIGHDTLKTWMAEEPRLAVYEQHLDNLFRGAQYVRSAEVEQVMGMVADPFGAAGNVYGQLTSADMSFEPAISSIGEEQSVAQSTREGLLASPDRATRQSAWESYADGYLALKNTLAATLITSIKQDVFGARVRGHQSSLAASLFQNNIPPEVFHNLIDTYKKNIPTWHRYWNVRRKVLGYDTLHPWDLWAPMTAEEPVVPYEQSVEWIATGMQPLGDAYVEAMRRGCLEERWVDVYPNQGKRAGAFSFGTYDTHPFIMMSYTNDLGSMSTLAHELGHSMHSYHSRKHQPLMYAGYSLFVAEVASNFNQALTRAYLREAKADDTAFQIALIQEAMENFHRYFFIMPTLARFEMEVHSRVEAGQGLTARDLNNLMADLFEEGYGGELIADRDRSGITWAQFGHLYSNFYVYQYATGISAAHALAAKILGQEDGAAQRYIEFLSTGGAKYPLDALLDAGVDMRSPDAVETTFAVLAEMVDRLEQLAGV